MKERDRLESMVLQYSKKATVLDQSIGGCISKQRESALRLEIRRLWRSIPRLRQISAKNLRNYILRV